VVTVIARRPSAGAARIGHGGQDGLLLVVNAVLSKQFLQFLTTDPALSCLDPADLGPVAFQNPGRVVKRARLALFKILTFCCRHQEVDIP
jgi:hypothetical protein